MIKPQRFQIILNADSTWHIEIWDSKNQRYKPIKGLYLTREHAQKIVDDAKQEEQELQEKEKQELQEKEKQELQEQEKQERQDNQQE